jgi:TetR/AcrR family transcriptional regulator, cholesterol catabolism regulator
MARIESGKSNSKKGLITHKAAILFKSRGYSSASMRELAESIGVEAPSLYNHIGSKSELLQIICFKVADAFTGQLQQAENGGNSIISKIESIIRFHIKMVLDHFDELYVANHEWKHLKEPYLDNFLTQRRDYEKRFVRLVEHGIKTGELKPTDPYVVVLTILSAVRGLEFWQHKKNLSAKTLENDMVSHLLNGIAK